MPRWIKIILPFIKLYAWFNVNFVEGLFWTLWRIKFQLYYYKCYNWYLDKKLGYLEWLLEQRRSK